MTRAFKLLWSSTGASNLADGMVLVLLPLLTIRTGTQAAGTALVTVALTLAWPLAGIHVGWLVDRFPRRTVLVLGNGARTLALGSVAVVSVFGDVPLPLILGVAVVYGLGETIVDTGINAAIPAVTNVSDRGRGNARIEGTIAVTNELSGPPLAGFLVGLGAAIALGATALLYLAASCLVLAIAFAARPALQPGERMRARDGLVILWAHRPLRQLTLLNALLNLTWSAWGAVFILHAVAPGPLGLNPVEYGALLSVGAVGGLFAAFANGWLRRHVSVTVLLFADTIGTLLLVAPATLGAPVWVVGAGLFAASAASTTWRILSAMYRQQEVHEAALGRVYAAYRVISWGTLPVGAGIAAAATAVAGVGAALAIASGIAVLCIVLFMVWIPRHHIQVPE